MSLEKFACWQDGSATILPMTSLPIKEAYMETIRWKPSCARRWRCVMVFPQCLNIFAREFYKNSCFTKSKSCDVIYKLLRSLEACDVIYRLFCAVLSHVTSFVSRFAFLSQVTSTMTGLLFVFQASRHRM